MDNELNLNEAFESTEMCDKVKTALFFGEELDDKMEKHLSECEDCRTFSEQSRIIGENLAALGKEAFVRDGVSVADAVMKEIEKQKMFTGGMPLKKKNPFRHGGLVAACIVVAVMAIPVLNGMLSPKNDNAAFESALDNSTSVADYGTEGYDAKEFFAAELYSYTDAETDGVAVVTDESYDTSSEPQAKTENGTLKVSGGSGGSGSSGGSGAVSTTVASEPARFTAPKNKLQSAEIAVSESSANETADITESLREEDSFEVLCDAEPEEAEAISETDITDIAVEKAEEVLGEKADKLTFSETHYAEDDSAVVTLEFESGAKIEVYFSKENGVFGFTGYEIK